MNQENITGNPTLDLLNKASGMSEFQTPVTGYSSQIIEQNNFNSGATTGNPTLDLLHQSSQQEITNNIFGENIIKSSNNQDFSFTEQRLTAPLTGNPTLDLLNQTTTTTQTSIPTYNMENPVIQSESSFVSFQPENAPMESVIVNPMIQGKTQFVTVQPDVEPAIPTQDLQAAAFGTPVNHPQFVQQSPEALFGGTSPNVDGNKEFNPFDFTAQ